MKKKVTYLVMTVNLNGEHFPYYEDAETAKDAVGKVRMYIDDQTDIDAVYREVRNW